MKTINIHPLGTRKSFEDNWQSKVKNSLFPSLDFFSFLASAPYFLFGGGVNTKFI
jgi:hypothetical protein